ncbi:hypothetical protein [Legionella quateirensis]|uniref:Coiled-coil protein n=1 Tax=Legionella quateirensis TaxID=45072 RepID=A0A378KUP1_9GAMM|nr:hypothetical protein [Legionella quateirensis]KTD43690.1 coiled-coil protein [Legionella quateirensis]STY17321.1 coiled-coil protein [Legionella quateirensis]
MGLEIFTWKSSSKGLGFANPVKSTLFGGNVGHAAVELTFPADARGEELAKKYQDVPGLSISKRTEIVPERQEDDSYKPKEQVSYFVYFSWWPGNTNGHHINNHRDDLESEWRHEPAPKIKSEIHEHLFEEGIPLANKTKVKGMLTRDKTIIKIKEIAHQQLQKDIEDDLAYKELKSSVNALVSEMQHLLDKGNLYRQELIAAAREQRKPDTNLDLNDAEVARVSEISKELRRLDAQIKLCKRDFEERHLSVGESPASVIRIPTNLDHNAPAFALDAEQVLDKMASLAESPKAYSFYKFNCSTTATEVVKAGISDELKDIMKNDGFSVDSAAKATIATPTSCRHFSQQIQTELIHLNLNQDLEINQDQIMQHGIKEAKASETHKTTTLDFKKRLHDLIKDPSQDVDEKQENSVEDGITLSMH